MARYNLRPKVADGIFMFASICIMGAPEVIPIENHWIGQGLFYIGLAGLILYPAWRWGWHYYKNRAVNEPETADNLIGSITDNRGIITQGQTGDNTIINPSTRDADGLYQGDKKIGRAEGPSINKSDSGVIFRAANFSDYPDPGRPIEYGGLLLECAETPRKQPGSFVGQLSATIMGLECKIIGYRDANST